MNDSLVEVCAPSPLVIRNAAGWECGMERDFGSYSPFSTSYYTLKQEVSTSPMLTPFYFQIFCIVREGENSRFLPGTKNIVLEWDDIHTNQGKAFDS